MPGHPRPCGLSCLPRYVFNPALWRGGVCRCALVAVMVWFGLLLVVPTACGQRIQLRREAAQNELVYGEGVYRFDSVFSSRRSNGSGLLKKQTRSPFSVRNLLTSQRLEQRRMVSRPRLAEVIKSRDFPELLGQDWQSMTVDQDTAGLFQAYGQLPDRQFHDVPHATFKNLDSLPVAVRQSQTDQQLFFYLANASPWRLRVRLQLAEDVSGQAIEKIDSLLRARAGFARHLDDPRALTVQLAPYDLVGASAEALGMIESYTFEYLDDVASGLRKRVFALQVKLQQAQQAKSLHVLSNPEFLASGSPSGRIAGWEIGQQPPSRFKLLNDTLGGAGDRKLTEKPTTGQSVKGEFVTGKSVQSSGANAKQIESYLQVRSVAAATTWVRSQPIKPTETGRLSISVWLRIPAETKVVPEIRMAIDGRTPTKEYYRFGAVGRSPADLLVSVEGRWKRFAVHFDDLPSSLTDLRIGFDVVGAGVVDISRVELFDRWFDNREAKAITQLLASADAMLRQPDQFDRCRRLLAEHWAVFLDDHFSLKPVSRNAQQPVPMFRPKVVDVKANVADAKSTVTDGSRESKQKDDVLKAGQLLNR